MPQESASRSRGPRVLGRRLLHPSVIVAAVLFPATLSAATLSFDVQGLGGNLLGSTAGSTGSSGFAVGETAIIDVRVAGIPALPAGGLTAFQLVLEFDPTQVRLFDPNNGLKPFMPLGDDAMCGAVREGECLDETPLLPSTGRIPVATPTIESPGVLSFGYATFGAADGPTGDGTLAVMGVERIGPLSTFASLKLSGDPSTKLLLADNTEISLDVGRLDVRAVPLPPAIGLFASALAVLGWKRRQRRTHRG